MLSVDITETAIRMDGRFFFRIFRKKGGYSSLTAITAKVGCHEGDILPSIWLYLIKFYMRYLRYT